MNRLQNSVRFNLNKDFTTTVEIGVYDISDEVSVRFVTERASGSNVITVTGANPGDYVVLGRPIDQDPGLVTEAFVSATSVVIVRAHNVQSVAVDQPAKLYKVLVIQP